MMTERVAGVPELDDVRNLLSINSTLPYWHCLDVENACGFGVCNETFGYCECTGSWQQSLEVDFENMEQNVQYSRCNYNHNIFLVGHVISTILHIAGMTLICAICKTRKHWWRSRLAVPMNLCGLACSLYWLTHSDVYFGGDLFYTLTFAHTMSSHLLIASSFLHRFLKYLVHSTKYSRGEVKTPSCSLRAFMVRTMKPEVFGVSMLLFLDGVVIVMTVLEEPAEKLIALRVLLYGQPIIMFAIGTMSVIVFTGVINELRLALELNRERENVSNKIKKILEHQQRFRTWMVVSTSLIFVVSVISMKYMHISVAKYIVPLLLILFEVQFISATYSGWKTGSRRARAIAVANSHRLKSSGLMHNEMQHNGGGCQNTSSSLAAIKSTK